jgi:small ligand-binding sensory domain FIST
MATSRFACAVSAESDSRRAEAEALEALESQLDGVTPDLVAAFATHHHGPALEELGKRLSRRTGAPTVFGCTAESVIGGGREIEGQPGLALWAASLPGTEVRFFEVSARCDGDRARFSAFPRVDDATQASLLLVCDPFSFPVDGFLQRLNDELPGVPAMGGLASGVQGPGQSLLFTADGVRDAGAVGVVIEGGIGLVPVVSQGCRPVGTPFVITACERNLIRGLGGRPALEVVLETLSALSPADQELFQGAPFVGLAVDATRSRFERGDLLVRGVIGLHQRDRAVAVSEFVRRGQTVQLLVRDPASASEDLETLVAHKGGGPLENGDARSAGALLFSCNGRGRRMFTEPDHDVSRVCAGLSAKLPVAGFFAAGEIGPVGGRNFLHGFTASVALFRAREARASGVPEVRA